MIRVNLIPKKRCTKCGEEKPASLAYFYSCKTGKNGLLSICKVCIGAKNKKWISEHPEKTKEYNHRWYDANREAAAESKRVFRAEHPEASRAATKRWHDTHLAYVHEMKRRYLENHLEQNREKARRFRALHPDIAKKYVDEWLEKHPEARRVYSSSRRARVLGAEGTHTRQDVLDQYKWQKGRCFYCREKVGDNYHVDHVTPLSRGGSDGPENIVIACPSCNLRKHATHPMDFAGIML